MSEQFIRTELLLGSENLSRLQNSKVLIFGVGGVGGFVVEALARAGVGHIDIVDKDVVDESNINRQLIATHKTVGVSKVKAFYDRIKDINPDCDVKAYEIFYLPETRDEFDFHDYDYVVDAVDTVTAKIDIIMQAKACDTKVISAMGAGNKLDPTQFEVTDIYKTSMCPLAKVMRKELKVRGVKDLKVVYSKEKPLKPRLMECNLLDEVKNTGKRSIPGSISFVPSVAGLIIASEVVKDLIK